MKTLTSIIALLAVTLMAAPIFAQPAATDTIIVTATSDSITVNKQSLEDWTTLALASGMPDAFSALRKKVASRPAGSGYTGNGRNILNAMAKHATANSRNLAWANALTAANGDSVRAAADPTYIAFQEAVRTGNAKVRVAIGTQFVNALTGGTMSTGGVTQADIDAKVDARVNQLVANGTLVRKSDLQTVAHQAAVLETGSKSEKKAAARWLANY